MGWTKHFSNPCRYAPPSSVLTTPAHMYRGRPKGAALLALGRAGEAVEVLDATVTAMLASVSDPDQSVLVGTRFSLAQALWRSGRDRDRARSVASDASERAAKLGKRAKADLEAIEGWLASPR